MVLQTQFIIYSQWEDMIQASAIISDYLDTKSSDEMSTVLSQLDRLPPGDPEQLSLFLMDFWETFMEIARQVQCGSEEQTRLLDLIRALIPRAEWYGSSGNLNTAIRYVFLCKCSSA
jgi:hypothetical protein